jgi:hypothetical protein
MREPPPKVEVRLADRCPICGAGFKGITFLDQHIFVRHLEVAELWQVIRTPQPPGVRAMCPGFEQSRDTGLVRVIEELRSRMERNENRILELSREKASVLESLEKQLEKRNKRRPSSEALRSQREEAMGSTLRRKRGSGSSGGERPVREIPLPDSEKERTRSQGDELEGPPASISTPEGQPDSDQRSSAEMGVPSELPVSIPVPVRPQSRHGARLSEEGGGPSGSSGSVTPVGDSQAPQRRTTVPSRASESHESLPERKPSVTGESASEAKAIRSQLPPSYNRSDDSESLRQKWHDSAEEDADDVISVTPPKVLLSLDPVTEDDDRPLGAPAIYLEEEEEEEEFDDLYHAVPPRAVSKLRRSDARDPTGLEFSSDHEPPPKAPPVKGGFYDADDLVRMAEQATDGPSQNQRTASNVTDFTGFGIDDLGI